jgi:YVTN family beta-propeller protein
MTRSMLRAAALCIAAGLTIASISPVASAQKAYVPNYSDNTVTVINTATDLRCTSSTCSSSATYPVPVGSGPIDVAISLDGTKAYILDSSDGEICVITTATDAVSCPMTAAIRNNPYAMSITPDGAYIYAVGYSSLYGPGIMVVNTSTMAEVTGSGLPIYPSGSGYLIGVAISPTGNQLYATDYGASSIVVVDTSTRTVTTTIPLTYSGTGCPCAAAPIGVVFSPDGSAAYVADTNTAVFSINTSTNSLVTTVTGVDNGSGFTQGGLVVSPDGHTVYASTYSSDGSEDVVQRIDFSQSPPSQLPINFANAMGISGMAINPDGSKLYASRYDNAVQVVRTLDNYQLYLSGAPWPISTGTGPGAYGRFIVAPSEAPQGGSSSVTVVGNSFTPLGTVSCGALSDGWCQSPDTVLPLTTSSSGTWPSSNLADVSVVVNTYTIDSTLYGIVATGAANPYNQIEVNGASGYTVQVVPCTSSGSPISGFPSGFSNPVTFSGTRIFQATNDTFFSSTYSAYNCWQVALPTTGSGSASVWLRNTPVP